MKYSGNIVTFDQAAFGTILWDGEKIEKITLSAPVDPEKSWIVPGFIDTHLHGLAEGGLDYNGVVRMAEFCPETGVTALSPTLDSVMPDETLEFLNNVREIMTTHPCGKRIIGSHLEGPFLAPEYAGGMLPEALRLPDLTEVKRLLDAAGEKDVGPAAHQQHILRLLGQNLRVEPHQHTAGGVAADAGVAPFSTKLFLCQTNPTIGSVNTVAKSETVTQTDGFHGDAPSFLLVLIVPFHHLNGKYFLYT